MKKTFPKWFIVLLVIVGCSNLTNESEEKLNEPKTANSNFTGTITNIKSNTAIVTAKLGEGDVFVNLSVNNDETLQVGDRVNVGYNGTYYGIESSPNQYPFC